MAGPYVRPVGSDQAGASATTTKLTTLLDALSDGLEDFESVAIKANGQLELVASSGTAATSGRVGLFSRATGGRVLPAYIGPSGLDSSLQPLLAANKVLWIQPNGNSTTIGSMGGALTAIGTATAANWANTSLHTSMRRIDYLVTTASTSAVAGFRGAAQQFWRGNAAGLGGFYFRCRWAPATGQSTSTKRAYCGLRASSSASTDVNPSSLTNICGIGIDNGDANWQFMTNDGSGTATKSNLGASFAVSSTDRATMFDTVLFCAPNDSQITWQHTDLVSGASASGTATTDLPVNTTALNPYGYCSVGGTSSVIGFALASLYIETDQ